MTASWLVVTRLCMSEGPGVITSLKPPGPTLATRSRLSNMAGIKASLSEDDILISQYSGSASKDSVGRSKKIKNVGLQHPRAVTFLVLWYIFSGITLFLNKYILTYQKADPHVLCGMQMLITMFCGLVQMRYPLGTYKHIKGQQKPDNFKKSMLILGLLQLGTIMFGLIAIYYVAVSFAETVKSSAPLFTVLIAYFVLGERTGAFVFFSLIPVMLGLALCSSNELSFSIIGFLCALTTNLCECVQSVVSKSLLSNKAYIYSVANTTKRACLIWLSVLLFGNPVTVWSGIGTAVVIGGVLLYSKAREIDARRREQFSITEEKMNSIR
ncbi:solute carrier family 35 member E2B isoform X3 [Cherax quadricarinatus]|uniref:solute carrier family 35 member E2B isoform X3 n=1 Tax=Cherax quadricarinatus TaxID=27406 RepID=UPI00387E3C08